MLADEAVRGVVQPINPTAWPEPIVIPPPVPAWQQEALDYLVSLGFLDNISFYSPAFLRAVYRDRVARS